MCRGEREREREGERRGEGRGEKERSGPAMHNMKKRGLFVLNLPNKALNPEGLGSGYGKRRHRQRIKNTPILSSFEITIELSTPATITHLAATASIIR